jgi:hypothetical protein
MLSKDATQIGLELVVQSGRAASMLRLLRSDLTPAGASQKHNCYEGGKLRSGLHAKLSIVLSIWQNLPTKVLYPRGWNYFIYSCIFPESGGAAVVCNSSFDYLLEKTAGPSVESFTTYFYCQIVPYQSSQM